MTECSHCDGRGIMTVEDRTHDVLHYEPCYCSLQSQKEQEELARSIASVFIKKVSLEKLALTLASVIVERHAEDEYAEYQLKTLAQDGNAAWLLNWSYASTEVK